MKMPLKSGRGKLLCNCHDCLRRWVEIRELLDEQKERQRENKTTIQPRGSRPAYR